MMILISGAIMAGSTHVAEFIVFRFFALAGAWMSAAASPVRDSCDMFWFIPPSIS